MYILRDRSMSTRYLTPVIATPIRQFAAFNRQLKHLPWLTEKVWIIFDNTPPNHSSQLGRFYLTAAYQNLLKFLKCLLNMSNSIEYVCYWWCFENLHICSKYILRKTKTTLKGSCIEFACYADLLVCFISPWEVFYLTILRRINCR
jgi:hypothetical protein